MRRLLPILCLITLLWGCATADRDPIVKTATSATPSKPSNKYLSKGSLVPVTQNTEVGNFKPLFEDRRAIAVGDTVTILLNETTSASKKSGAGASRGSNVSLSGQASTVHTNGLGANNKFTAGLGGDNAFSAAGNRAAENTFSGTITVTVIEVLKNGNLVVAGEKQLAVGTEEEVIRFGGVVNPNNLVNNTVSSAMVADARIEYRGRGYIDDTNSPGWLNRLMMKISPM